MTFSGKNPIFRVNPQGAGRQPQMSEEELHIQTLKQLDLKPVDPRAMIAGVPAQPPADDPRAMIAGVPAQPPADDPRAMIAESDDDDRVSFSSDDDDRVSFSSDDAALILRSFRKGHRT